MAATLTDKYLAKAADMGKRDGAAGRPAHERHSVHVFIVTRGALNWFDTGALHDAYLTAYDLAVQDQQAAALEEAQAPEKSAPVEHDPRIQAWHQIADHSFFKECCPMEEPLIVSMLAKLDRVHDWLTAVDAVAPAPEENFWDDRTTPSAGGTQ